MGMFHNIMNRLGRYRLIPDRRTDEDYMHRYYLFLKDRSWFPFNLTLHKIVRSDDPIMHDHPWSYLTIILKGGYNEHIPLMNPQGKMIGELIHWRGPGSIIFRKATAYHWLELEDGKSATTLFFMGPQKREWGFLVEAKKGLHRWVKNEHYLTHWRDYHTKFVAPKAASRKKE